MLLVLQKVCILSFRFTLLLMLYFFAQNCVKPPKVFASEYEVIVISEVYPAPQQQEEEWIEIYNSSNEVVTLNGLQIFDTVSSESLIHSFENETLNPYSFILIELEQAKLNNSGDTLLLKNAELEIIDTFTYSQSESQMSIARYFTNQTEISNTSAVLTPTPLEINQIKAIQPSPTPTPTESPETTPVPESYPIITISDAENCPEENEAEWVLLESQSSETYQLSDWFLKDEQDNLVSLSEYSLTKSKKIQLSKTIFNNSGDTVYLFNPSDEQVSQLLLPDCKKTTQTTESTDLNGIEVANNTEKKPIETQMQNREQEQKINQINTGISQEHQIFHTLSQELSSNLHWNTESQTEGLDYIQHTISLKESSNSGILSVIIGGAILLLSGIIL